MCVFTDRACLGASVSGLLAQALWYVVKSALIWRGLWCVCSVSGHGLRHQPWTSGAAVAALWDVSQDVHQLHVHRRQPRVTLPWRRTPLRHDLSTGTALHL